MNDFFNSIALLLILLNPFLVIVYLMELVQDLDLKVFSSVLVRGGIIATGIHATFALLGDAVFTELLHAEFASFQIFGGIVFLLVGINFMLKGNEAIEALRGPAEHIAGSIAMPIMVGPATISASVMIGKTLSSFLAVLGILVAVGGSVVVMIVLKMLHDWVKPRNEGLVRRYVEIAGRVMALIVGIYAVEMIMQGTAVWIERILASL
ncbi:MAG: MarC family protein [bacterium]|nr:MarC family protein [bacterium]MDT8366356.1 MarC family protein [bacterium]